MARWANKLTKVEATGLHTLFDRLSSVRPDGWSVIQGDRELIVRPGDRSLGKFNVTVSSANTGFNFRLGFFSRSLNHWHGHEHYDAAQYNTSSMINWMQHMLKAEQARCGKDSG